MLCERIYLYFISHNNVICQIKRKIINFVFFYKLVRMDNPTQQRESQLNGHFKETILRTHWFGAYAPSYNTKQPTSYFILNYRLLSVTQSLCNCNICVLLLTLSEFSFRELIEYFPISYQVVVVVGAKDFSVRVVLIRIEFAPLVEVFLSVSVYVSVRKYLLQSVASRASVYSYLKRLFYFGKA